MGVSEECKQAVMEMFEKNSKKGKKKMYPKDAAKALSDQFPRKEIKLAIQELIAEDKMAYWSSGSTTYTMLKADYDELAAKEEE